MPCLYVDSVLSLLCPCPPTRCTEYGHFFSYTLLSVYRVSHVKCCVHAILFEIIARIDALFRLNLNLMKINNIYLKNVFYILLQKSRIILYNNFDSIFFTEFFIDTQKTHCFFFLSCLSQLFIYKNIVKYSLLDSTKTAK